MKPDDQAAPSGRISSQASSKVSKVTPFGRVLKQVDETVLRVLVDRYLKRRTSVFRERRRPEDLRHVPAKVDRRLASAGGRSILLQPLLLGA